MLLVGATFLALNVAQADNNPLPQNQSADTISPGTTPYTSMPSPYTNMPSSYTYTSAPSPYIYTSAPSSYTYTSMPSPYIYTSAPSPYTNMPSPYTSVPTPSTMMPSPYTSVPSPYTSMPTPHTSIPTPSTTMPTPYTVMPTPYTSMPSPYTSMPTPSTTTSAPSSMTSAPSSMTSAPTLSPGPTTAAPSQTPSVTSTPTSLAPTAVATATNSTPGQRLTDAPTAAPTTMAVVSNTSGTILILPATTVDVPPNQAFLTGGTLTGSVTPSDLFVSRYPGADSNPIVSNYVLTIDFAPSGGNVTPVPSLENPVTFNMPLSIRGIQLLGGEDVCMGPVVQTLFPEAICAFFDHNSSNWDATGCATENVTGTSVDCACSHFTDFAVIIPKYNYVRVQDLKDLDVHSIERHPAGIVTLAVVYIIFFATFAYAYRFDHKEKADASLRQEKEAKWMASLESGLKMPFWKRYKSQLQKKHTWFSLYFRKKGSSYRSVDRTCATLLSVLTIMALNAYFYGQAQTWVGYGAIIVFSALCSFIPLMLMEIIFSRIGVPGYKDVFEMSHGLRPVPKNKCCQQWAVYRFPWWFSYVMYVIILGVAVALSVQVLLLAYYFDTNKEFICTGKGSSAWVVSVLITILVNIFVVQPLKIFVSSVILHVASHAQQPASKLRMEALADKQQVPAMEEETD